MLKDRLQEGFGARLFRRIEEGIGKAAFRLLYESGLNVGQALAQAKTQSWGGAGQSFFDFVAGAKRRGICGLRRTAGSSGAD